MRLPLSAGKRASSEARIGRDLLGALAGEVAADSRRDDDEALADVVSLELLLLGPRGRDDDVGRPVADSHEETHGRPQDPLGDVGYVVADIVLVIGMRRDEDRVPAQLGVAAGGDTGRHLRVDVDHVGVELLQGRDEGGEGGRPDEPVFFRDSIRHRAEASDRAVPGRGAPGAWVLGAEDQDFVALPNELILDRSAPIR